MRRLATTLALAALLAVPATAAAVDAPGLRASLSKRAPNLGAASGVRVVDLATGRELYNRQEDRARIPASNEKLYVTAAALLELGPQTRFRTTVAVPQGTLVDSAGVLHGDLYLVGGGDPALGDIGMQGLADQIARAGIRRISGGVRADESLFDVRRGGPRTGFLPDIDMGGVLGALTWGHGRTGPNGPAVVAAERLHRFLKTEGITLGRRPRPGVLEDPAPQQLAALDSPTVAELAEVINVYSDNFYAEILTKHLGAREGATGTTGAGLGVVRSTLGSFGIRPRLADGSGLSRANRTTPRQVVRLLARMAGQEISTTWMDTMAVMGRTGTLRKRLRGTTAAGRCFGKTGTINGVSALSGYCRQPDGELTGFSILANGVCTPCAKRIEDRMVASIARYDS